MASLFNPICGISLFNMTSSNTVKECGRINGYMVSILLSIITVISCGFWFAYHKNIDNEDKTKSSWWIWLVMVGILIAIWIIIPYLLVFINLRNYNKITKKIKLFESRGDSREIAIKNMYQTS